MNILSLNIRGIIGGAKASWVKEIKKSNNIGAIALQETKLESVSKEGLVGYWDDKNFEFASAASVGLSGGLVWIWDPEIFKVEETIQNRCYLIIRGSLVGSGAFLNLMNVYAPQSVVAKRHLWDNISARIDEFEGKRVVVLDFNVVRSVEERRNSQFKAACAENFNNFIFEKGLQEYPMQGRKFTCIRNNGRKLSKLDRFLVCSEIFNSWPQACVRVLPGRYSDHCPIILEVANLNYGPRPFRVFSSWIGRSGFEEAVREASESFVAFDPPDVSLSAKFALIRGRLKEWRDDFLSKEKESENLALSELENLESEMESMDLSEEEERILAENKKLLEKQVTERIWILEKELERSGP
ncbi:uncharacterized protein LOC110875692 [Helianthus annuus]|uniref:uncharacterized protein LOC110875692 n=1 Tax=Helianthus annuus TaxID=4232 RepID=UPI000B900FE3|nr:uncharacterized protein LOC110875692 [Helianthus annuus]